MITVLIDFILWIWQLPQHILALLLMTVVRPKRRIHKETGYVYHAHGGTFKVCLGNYSFLPGWKRIRHPTTGEILGTKDEEPNIDSIKHESIGHAKQSMMLGPLYLLLVGLPSVIVEWRNQNGFKGKKSNEEILRWRYEQYPEKWADQLAGIDREAYIQARVRSNPQFAAAIRK
jgi:hypothetical protein